MTMCGVGICIALGHESSIAFCGVGYCNSIQLRFLHPYTHMMGNPPSIWMLPVSHTTPVHSLLSAAMMDHCVRVVNVAVTLCMQHLLAPSTVGVSIDGVYPFLHSPQHNKGVARMT